jgi:hypothetical protein
MILRPLTGLLYRLLMECEVWWSDIWEEKNRSVLRSGVLIRSPALTAGNSTVFRVGKFLPHLSHSRRVIVVHQVFMLLEVRTTGRN